MNNEKCRSLILGDIIQVGDEWWDHAFEAGGAWIEIKEGNADIGTIYVPERMKPVRRPM